MASKSRPLPLSRTDWQHVVPLLVIAITAGFAAQAVLRFWAWWRGGAATHGPKERPSTDYLLRPPAAAGGP